MLQNTTTPADQYNPATKNWESLAAASVPLVLITKGTAGYREVGPVVLRPDGTVFAAGATGHTALYNTNTNTWTNGQSFPTATITGSCAAGSYTNPEQFAAVDAPAALLPNGNVLVEASPVDDKCSWIPGTKFFEFDGTNLNEVASTANGPFTPSFVGRLLTLPNGQVLFLDSTGDAEIYTSSGSPFAGSAPAITTSPAAVGPGAANMLITGTQLNGLSGAVAYGDDYQAATNYPLVRITNTGTGHVFYARTHGHSSMGVATGTSGSTYFDVPPTIETGASTMVVVANGIASGSVPITIRAASNTALGSSSNPSTKGNLVTFTATVTGTGLTGNGTVTFYDGTDSAATALASNVTLIAGVATFQTSTLSIGTHTITATYRGDSTLGDSTSTAVLQVINGQATTTVVGSGTNPSLTNNTVTFTATVTPTGGGTPTGTVTYLDANSTSDGNTVLGTVTLGAFGIVPSIFVPLQFSGTHTITAVYSGDSIFSGSTSTAVQQQVNNPVPSISSLRTSSIGAGAAGFNLVVHGSNFVNGAVVNFNGNARGTTFQASSQVVAAILPSDLTTAGVFPVTVTNPAPGGGTSGSQTFTVNLLTLSPDPLAFGNQSVGATHSALILTVTNNRGTSATLAASTPVTLSGGNAGDFAISANTCTASLVLAASGGSCSLSITFTPSATGARGTTVSVASNASNSPTSASVTGTGVDYTITPPTAPTATVPAGQPASFTFSVATSIAPLIQAITFHISALPRGVTATFNPPSLPAGSASGNTVLTLTTTAKPPATGSTGGGTTWWPRPPAGLIYVVALFALWLGLRFGMKQQQRLRYSGAALLLAVVLSISVLAGCARSGGGSSSTVDTSSTPSGSYNLTVTAQSDDGVVRSAVVTLNVQ